MTAARKAVETYRRRLRERGLDRFEVRGREVDKPLLRALADRLAVGGSEADALRATLRAELAPEAQRRGGVFAALRRSPHVGVDIAVEREVTPGREIDL